jgi:hypothetical protein
VWRHLCVRPLFASSRKRTLVLALWASTLAFAPQFSFAQSCDNDITLATGVCVQQTGLDNAATCRKKAVQDCNCDLATNMCAGTQSCSPDLQAKAKINVDWIFSDGGARNTFDLHRQMGESAFEAAVSAQAHNPPVQALLRQCRAWVEAYLRQPGGCSLGNREPGPDSCQCVSVLPTGQFDQTGTPIYQVTNSCPDGMNVSVQFVDAASSGGSPSIGQAHLIYPSKSYTLRPPQTFAVPSISAIGLQTAGGAYTCVCREALCN